MSFIPVFAGACGPADLALFFGPDRESDRRRQIRTAKAKAICSGCPARAACLEFATERGLVFGVWGGVDLETPGPQLCRNGLHQMDAANTYVDVDRHRNCRACRNAADARARQRQEGEAAA